MLDVRWSFAGDAPRIQTTPDENLSGTLTMTTSSRRSHLCYVVTALLTVSIAASGVSHVCAQSGDDLAKGLLRALIESRLEKDRRRRVGRDPFRPVGQATREIEQLRTISATYAQEATALSAVLNTDARRDYHVREHLPATLQFEATAAVVRQQTAAARNHATLADTYRQLNSQWLTLSHQLRHQHGVSPQAIAILDRIGILDQQYCALLGIQQQFDHRQLVRAADLLSAELRHLGEALQYAVPASATRARLIRNLQRLQQQAGYFANLAADNPQLEQVVREYQRLYQSWVGLEVDLDRYRNRSVTRGVQRVAAAQQTVHGLLRLDFGLDKRLVQHLIRDVETAMTELFQQITLADLMNLADSDEVASAADTAYGTLQHLADVVNRDETPRDIGEAWVFMDEAWDLLAYYLSPVRNPGVQHQLEVIARQLAGLQDTVGATVAWDDREMAQRSAALETTAEGIRLAIQRWHQSAGITDQHRSHEAQELISHCHELEQLIFGHRPPAEILAECNHVIEAWQHLRPYLRECQTAERNTLEQLAAAFTPELIRIRTALPE